MFLVKERDILRSESKTRLCVLRRDHYRCRGCDTKGDEVTLNIHQIQSETSNIEEKLTLCARCQDIVQRLNLRADRIPEFLQQLWCQLYPALQTEYPVRLNPDRVEPSKGGL